MNKLNISKLCLICFIILALGACTNDKHQQQFEEQARSAPAGIRVMDANGTHPEGTEQDEDDWRTAPKFSGIFRVETAAYPNPVAFNSTLEIQIYTALNSVSGLYIYAFQLPSDLNSARPVVSIAGNLSPGLQTIRIYASDFAQSGQTGTSDGLYRLIIYNGNDEVMSYGDVRVK